MGLCRICGKNYGAFGNNGVPLINGMVCNSCNDEVVMFRMESSTMGYGSLGLEEIIADGKVAKIQLEIEKKKNVVAKNCIKTLGDTAKKYKEELDEIAKEECVMPMIDRIMEDANNDVKKIQEELDAVSEVAETNMGYRVAHKRMSYLQAENLFIETIIEQMDEIVDDNTITETLVRIGICSPEPLTEEEAEILEVSYQDRQAHYQSERMNVATAIHRYATQYLEEKDRTDLIALEPIPCPFCEECRCFHMWIRSRAVHNANNID